MPIYIGDNQLVKRYVGEQPVLRVFQGDQLVWSAVTPYPKTGTWPGGAVPLGVTTQATHTITVAGNFTLNWSVPFTVATNGTLAGARIFVNGTVVKSGAYLNFPGTSTANTTRDLAAGDVVEFRTDTSKNDAVADPSTWTITKN